MTLPPAAPVMMPVPHVGAPIPAPAPPAPVPQQIAVLGHLEPDRKSFYDYNRYFGQNFIHVCDRIRSCILVFQQPTQIFVSFLKTLSFMFNY